MTQTPKRGRPLWSYLVISFFALLMIAGCGDSNNDFVVTGDNPNNNPGTLTFQFFKPQAAEVPTATTDLRFDYINTNGDVIDSDTVDFAETVTVTPPAGTVTIRITAIAANGFPLSQLQGAAATPPLNTNLNVNLDNFTATDISFDALTVTPDPTAVTAGVNVGNTQQLTVTANFSNGQNIVFNNALLAATDFNVNGSVFFTVNDTGLVSAVSAGPGTLTATYTDTEGTDRSDTINVNVTGGVTPDALVVTPDTLSIPVGDTSTAITATLNGQAIANNLLTFSIVNNTAGFTANAAGTVTVAGDVGYGTPATLLVALTSDPTITDTVAITATPPAPQANDDTFVALGNGTLTESAANGVLKNDVVNGGTVVPFQGNTSNGGVLNLAADGSFTYTPVAGFLGTDDFEYTLSNETGSSTANALIVVSKRAYFVDTTAASNGTGTQASPFNNINDAFSAARFSDTVFVFGSSTVGPLTVPRGINLIGQGSGLSVDQSSGQIAAQTIVEPGARPTLTGPVIPTSDNVIAGFRIADSANVGVNATNIFNVTIRSNLFEDNATEHISFGSSSGALTANVESNTFNTPPTGRRAIEVINNTGNKNVVLNIDRNTFLSDGSTSPSSAIYILRETSDPHQYNIRGNTITGADNTASYTEGIFVECGGGSSMGLDVRDNVISGIQNHGIRLFSKQNGQILGEVFNNQVSGSGLSNLFVQGEGGNLSSVFNVYGNVLTDSDDDGMRIEIIQGVSFRFVISGNTISDNADDGLFFSQNAGADATLIVQGNAFSTNGDDGFEGSLTNGSGMVPVALRNNQFFGSGGSDFEFGSDATDGGQPCFDITGNTFRANLVLNQANIAVYTVERFAEGLENFNTFISGSVSTTGTITPAAAGACNIF